MTMQTIPYFMRHFNRYVRKHVPQDDKLMTLDGHSSRKGIIFLKEATETTKKAKIPANVSHVSQSFDQRVSKLIKSRDRRVRDHLSEAGMTNTKGVKFS